MNKVKAPKELEVAKPHTIQKFQLIEDYVKAWAYKLLQYKESDVILFIDCMCNSGLYQDIAGNLVEGTPIRIAKLLTETMHKFPDKKAELYLNDIEAEKIEKLKLHLPPNLPNCSITTSAMDANILLQRFQIKPKYPFLLVYDPYQATINWQALTPFLNAWGEIIVNHMVSDVIRGLPTAKKQRVKTKYVNTYQTDIDDLIAIGSDRKAYEDH